MRVSVVIPTYNGRHLLEKHLPNVLALLRNGDEVIVVDDASTDDTHTLLALQFPQVRVVCHATNMRFAQSCNDGVAAAKYEIILLLNNDVSPKKDLFANLFRHFTDSRVFAVGCAEVNSQGIVSGRSKGAFRRGMFVHWRDPDQTGATTLWAAGGSMAVRRSLWLELGGMDTLFRPAYEEDRDLSYRALKLGFRVVFEPKALVAHDHETTNKTAIGERELRVASYKNLFLLYWKNITDIELLLSHMFWLPYHLFVGGIRSRGELTEGFAQALHQLPQLYQRRRLLTKQWMLCDHEVMENL